MPMMNIAALLVLLACAYIWLTRGFFSALIHMICTVIAGAIAFGVFEAVGYFLLDTLDPLGPWGGAVWSFSLGGTFAIALILIRFGVDRLLPANVAVPTVVNYIGGGLCGLVAGVISSGIMVLSISSLRLETAFWDYTPVAYNPTGNPVHNKALWVPVDRITVGLYGHLSERALRIDDPLARWHPELADEGTAMRMNPFDGKGRNTIGNQEFNVVASFTVGKGSGLPFTELNADRWNGQGKPIVMADGNPPPSNTFIQGLLIDFKAGSKERDGRTAVGAGQVQLLLENPDTSERMVVYPCSVSSQGDPTTAAGTYRWRYDSPDVFIASVGGGSDAYFAFEFPCPQGYQPVAVYVKGTRKVIEGTPVATPKWQFGSAAERDEQIRAGFGIGPAATWLNTFATNNTSSAKPKDPIPGFDIATVNVIGNGGALKSGEVPEGVRISHTVGRTIQKGEHGGLEIDDNNIITGGMLRTTKEIMKSAVGLEPGLRIEQFQATSDADIVQVDVDATSRTSILGKALSMAESLAPIVLVDTQGERYDPIGYIYEDESEYRVSFNPGQPITSMTQLPSLSSSRPAQKLRLIYKITYGREVKYLSLGQKVLYEYNPPFRCDQQQVNRGPRR